MSEKLKELMFQRIDLKANEKRLKIQIENVDADIKLELEVAGINNFEHEHNTIVLRESTRNGFDNTKAKTFLTAEQITACAKITTYQSLFVKSAEENKRVKKFMEKKKND